MRYMGLTSRLLILNLFMPVILMLSVAMGIAIGCSVVNLYFESRYSVLLAILANPLHFAVAFLVGVGWAFSAMFKPKPPAAYSVLVASSIVFLLTLFLFRMPNF